MDTCRLVPDMLRLTKVYMLFRLVDVVVESTRPNLREVRGHVSILC